MVVSHDSLLIAPVVPVLLCAPKFLDGSMSLGEMLRAASALEGCRQRLAGLSTTIRVWLIEMPVPNASLRC
jgi:ABC-type uncharacterized transport system fused permease/ATPase subunit